MSVPLTVNGVTFQYPQTGNQAWGAAAAAWAQAITTGTLQKAGGSFTLTNEVDFGADYGLKSISFKSRSSNVAQSGVFRNSNTDLITWRNGANSGDNTLGVSPSNVLLYNGVPVAGNVNVDNTPTINLDVTDSVLTANLVENSITDGYINENAGIVVSKLAGGTEGQFLVSNDISPVWVNAAGDETLDGTGNFTTVGIRGKPLSSTLATIGATQDGYALVWNNALSSWDAAAINALTAVSNVDHIFLTPSNEVGFRKSSHKQFIFEEFEYTFAKTLGVGTSELLTFANTNWEGSSAETAGSIVPSGSEQYHPGICTLSSGGSGGGPQSSWMNLGNANLDGYNYFPYYVGDIYEIESVFKINTPNEFGLTYYQFMFGLSDNALLDGLQNAVVFYQTIDVGGDGYVQNMCKHNGSATDISSSFIPDGYWTKYTLRQDVAGQFKFYINEILKNTITTNVPSDKVLTPFFVIGPSPGVSDTYYSMDIDYFSLTTNDLGSRFGGGSGGGSGGGD